jgi:hypothetical protein
VHRQTASRIAWGEQAKTRGPRSALLKRVCADATKARIFFGVEGRPSVENLLITRL